MADLSKTLRVVVASPGDVRAERNVVERVVQDLNNWIAADHGLLLRVIRWETDAYPGFHPEGPQGLIDPILRIGDSDIVIGIFWKRFGTPVQDARSGAEHELRLAYDAWTRTGRPEVMVYFNQKPYTPRSKDEIDQWGQVLDFRESFPREGLWWPYKGTREFERLLRSHIINYIRNKFTVASDHLDLPQFTTSPKSNGLALLQRTADYFNVQQGIIEEQSRTYFGRTSVEQALSRFLDTCDRGYFIVRAAPGQGKTAFACHLVQTKKFVHHLIGRTGGRADERLILRSLLFQISLKIDARREVPDSLSELTKTYDEILPIAAARQAPFLIVIDALDELPGESPEVPSYFAADTLPKGVYFVVTSRPGDHLERLRQRLFSVPNEVHELAPLDKSEIRAILLARKLDVNSGELEQLADASQGNPLYLRAAADQLELNPGYNLSVLPSSIEGFYQELMNTLKPDNKILRDILGILSVSRCAMSVRELSEIAGKKQHEVFEDGLRPVRQFLLEKDGLYTFYHSRFHEFVTGTILYEDELLDAHSRISAWLQRPNNHSLGYRWNSLTYHLYQSGGHSELIKTIGEEFLSEKARRLGYAVLEDLELLTRALLEMGDPAVIERSIRVVEAIRNIVGGDIVFDTARILSPYGPRVPSFRGRVISPSVPTVPELDIYVGILPKARIACDFFEILPVDNHLVVAIGDAPGSGLKSAFVARFIGNLFHETVDTGNPLDLAGVLVTLNSRLAVHDFFEIMTLQCAELDPMGGILRIANAGHPYPVHYSACAAKCDILPVDGPALCIPSDQPSSTQEYQQYSLRIAQGDVIVLLTDGLTEGHVLTGDSAYGYRFTHIVEAFATQGSRRIGEAILADWRDYSRDEDYVDDASLIVVTVGRAPVVSLRGTSGDHR